MLKDKYGKSILVTDFLMGLQNVVRFLLTVDIVPCDYDTFLYSFVRKYIVENHVDPNQILLTEITLSWWKDMLDCLSGYVEKGWIGFVGSILNCMSSTRVKLEVVKSLFEAVSVQLRKAAYN
ncbi:hypothetical protein MTP99_015791 [Tenebrio molitor]|nr:hypothetical protein MTP99_015791 [Tenebrio molitor]